MSDEVNKTRFLVWAKSDMADMYARLNNIADALDIRDQVPRVTSNSSSNELNTVTKLAPKKTRNSLKS